MDTKKKVILVSGLIFISILGTILIFSLILTNQFTNDNEDDFTDDAMIYINDQIPKYSWKATDFAHDWCSGSGTLEDPYVIKINVDTSVNGSVNGYSNGISIWNSSAYFVICNCSLKLHTNYGCGIRLVNVNNGVVRENMMEDNGYGIFAYNCFNVNISMNDVLKNHYEGIVVSGSPQKKCSDVYIQKNYIKSGLFAGIDLWDCRNILVTKNWVNDCRDGIYMNRANENLITDCIVKSCRENGIILRVSDLNFISNNTFNYNGEFGLQLSQSDRNQFLNNSISNNRYDGVYLSYSGGNKFINNSINYGGVNLHIGYDNTYKTNTFISNTVNNKALYYYKDGGLNPADFSNAGQIILIGSSNTVISEVNITHVGLGILLVDCQNIFIRNASISRNLWNGIEIQRSNNIELTNNTIFNNKKYGIFCKGCGSLNISNNTLSKNDWGIWIWESNNVKIENNLIVNSTTGIYSDSSYDNFIKSNMVLQCERGIQSSSSSNNDISKNFLLNNTYGSYTTSGSDLIFNENLVENNNYGMYFSRGNNHIISNNSILHNRFGVYMKSTNYTIIKYNKFTANQNHIEQINCFGNILMENTFLNKSLSLSKSLVKASSRSISSIIKNLAIVSLGNYRMIQVIMVN